MVAIAYLFSAVAVELRVVTLQRCRFTGLPSLQISCLSIKQTV